MNMTTKSIIDRLPRRDLVAPGDIAAAYGLATATPIIADIKAGKLAANIINNRYIVSRDAAVKYIESNEYISDERETI